MSEVTQSDDFKKAVVDSRKLKAKPTNDELLQLYALFKQGTQDPPFDEALRPGTFDFTGKAKYNAWKAVVTEGVTPEEAQSRYAELVEKLKETYEYDADAVSTES
ncbi:MAG: hypothetical protein M1839_003681 [Geoglossum umbratile]|nr:MAG: hypothetical protein M1839_003681 [Geoglossum umbratile]